MPRPFEETVLGAMSRDPDDRPADMTAMLEQLGELRASFDEVRAEDDIDRFLQQFRTAPMDEAHGTGPGDSTHRPQS